MKITKIVLEYYQYKKLPRIGKYSWGFGTSIHKIINEQSGYKVNVKHTNSLTYLNLIYGNYKSGYISREDFINRLSKREYIKKYVNKFK